MVCSLRVRSVRHERKTRQPGDSCGCSGRSMSQLIIWCVQGEMDAGDVELSLLFSLFFPLGPMEDADGILTYLILTSSLKPF